MVSYGANLFSNVWDFQRNWIYVQFSPLEFNTGLNSQHNLLIFGLGTVIKDGKVFQTQKFDFFFHVWNFGPRHFKKSNFLNLAKFWAKRNQNLEIRLNQIFWLLQEFSILDTVTRPKIITFCWILKPVWNWKFFFAEYLKCLAFWG